MEYTRSIGLELKRKETQDVIESLELSAYFTHSKLNSVHIMLSLISAMTVHFKAENYLSAAGFAKRLRRMNPPKNMADQVCHI